MTAVNHVQHLSLGDGFAYSNEFRLLSQYMKELGNNGLNAVIAQAQRLRLFPSERPLDPHANRRLHLGHLRQY